MDGHSGHKRAKNKAGGFTRAKNRIRNRLVSGILLLLPFWITLTVIIWFFRWVMSFLRPIFSYLTQYCLTNYSQYIPENYIKISMTVFSIMVFLSLIYLVGSIGKLVIGRKIIKSTETLFLNIPMVKSIYSGVKQFIEAVSMPEKGAFKSVVLVDFPRHGIKAIGFLTGYITDNTGKKFMKVFLPTTPNPTTGFFEIVPIEEAMMTNLTIEEGFKMIISGGIIAPETISEKKETSEPPAKTAR